MENKFNKQVPTTCSQLTSSQQPEAQERRGQCQERHQPGAAARALPLDELQVSIFCVFSDDWFLDVAQVGCTACQVQKGCGLYEHKRPGHPRKCLIHPTVQRTLLGNKEEPWKYS